MDTLNTLWSLTSIGAFANLFRIAVEMEWREIRYTQIIEGVEYHRPANDAPKQDEPIDGYLYSE